MVSGCQMLAWRASPRLWEFEPSQAGSLIQQHRVKLRVVLKPEPKRLGLLMTPVDVSVSEKDV